MQSSTSLLLKLQLRTCRVSEKLYPDKDVPLSTSRKSGLDLVFETVRNLTVPVSVISNTLVTSFGEKFKVTLERFAYELILSGH